ncbi:hypothetical protein LC607_23890 [Nostoc sp. CHAB 5824]|nr:hypothetical protein [Nostoc sp. CHAB 5824]
MVSELEDVMDITFSLLKAALVQASLPQVTAEVQQSQCVAEVPLSPSPFFQVGRRGTRGDSSTVARLVIKLLCF